MSQELEFVEGYFKRTGNAMESKASDINYIEAPKSAKSSRNIRRLAASMINWRPRLYTGAKLFSNSAASTNDSVVNVEDKSGALPEQQQENPLRPHQKDHKDPQAISTRSARKSLDDFSLIATSYGSRSQLSVEHLYMHVDSSGRSLAQQTILNDDVFHNDKGSTTIDYDAKEVEVKG